MRLIDVNLLIYAFDQTARDHAAARDWVQEVLSGSETVAFSWAALIAFVRLTTNPRVMSKPLSSDEALDFVDSLLDQPCATVIHPTRRHSAILRDLLAPLGTAGNLTSDAHLAALAIEHGATLCSADNDFSRFPGLEWINPLSGR